MILTTDSSNMHESMIDIDLFINEQFECIYRGIDIYYESDGIISRLIDIVKSWTRKIVETIQKFTSEISIKIAKIKINLNKKIKTINSETIFPKNKVFESYDYLDASKEILKLSFIFSNGQKIKDNNDIMKSVKPWCGKETDTCTSKDIKSHILKKMIIKYDYIKPEKCLEEIKNFDNYISLIKKDSDLAKEEANDLIDYIKEKKSDTSISSLINKALSLNNTLLTTKISIIVGYMNQLLKIIGIYSNSEADKENNVSETFKDCVDNDDIRMIRIMLKDSMIQYRAIGQYTIELNYASKHMPSLWDDHDDSKFITYDKDKWDNDYENGVMADVVRNFSRKRVSHLENVVKYLHK